MCVSDDVGHFMQDHNLPVDKDTSWIIDSFKKLNMDFMLLSRRLEDNNLKAMS